MTNKSKNTVKASTTADKKKASNPTLASLKAKALKVLNNRIIKMLLLFTVLGLAYSMDARAGATGTAMLYMIAENGKKSGRADGNVYMRNGRIRGMAIPSLVRNAATAAARNAFGTLSAAFRSLSQINQNSWIEARGFFKSDRFGRPVEITGKALYNWLNGNIVDIGGNPMLVAPAPEAVGVVVIDAVAADDSANTVIVDLTDDVPATTSVKVFATAQQGAGVNRPGDSAYRMIEILPAGTTTPVDISASYGARFGQPVTGKKIFLKFVAVNENTGQAGVPSIGSTTVVA